VFCIQEYGNKLFVFERIPTTTFTKKKGFLTSNYEFSKYKTKIAEL